MPSKLHVIHGSYDDIKETNYDLIVAFGAIHNSPDFSITFKSLYNKLANNGKLLISDMCLTFIATSPTAKSEPVGVFPAVSDLFTLIV